MLMAEGASDAGNVARPSAFFTNIERVDPMAGPFSFLIPVSDTSKSAPRLSAQNHGQPRTLILWPLPLRGALRGIEALRYHPCPTTEWSTAAAISLFEGYPGAIGCDDILEASIQPSTERVSAGARVFATGTRSVNIKHRNRAAVPGSVCENKQRVMPMKATTGTNTSVLGTDRNRSQAEFFCRSMEVSQVPVLLARQTPYRGIQADRY
jgi:hypothetical protein